MTAATPKAADRQAAILKHSLAVFARMGYQNADVQVIADQAGVGKGTVYRHFGSKDQLFVATAEFCREALTEHVQRQVAANPELVEFQDAQGVGQYLRLLAREIARFYQDRPDALEILILERVQLRHLTQGQNPDLRANVRGLDEQLRFASEQGFLRQVPAESMTDAFLDLLFGSLINAGKAADRGEMVGQVERSMNLLLHGLLAVPESGPPRKRSPPRRNP